MSVSLFLATATTSLGGCVDSSKEAVVPDAGDTVRDPTSMALVKAMGPGFNLGNTLDAVGGETAWGNPPTTQAMIQAVANSGFKSMRIPVTWRGHFGPAPSYTIDLAWMNRVQQIVDWALGAGLYAIINMHHDGGTDIAAGAWIRNASTDYPGTLAEYQALWAQIAERFKDHGESLVFESMNEVGFDDLKVSGVPSQAAFDLLNQLNREFVTLVRASGGSNGQRHLLVAGYDTDVNQSIRGTVMPNDSRTILSIHYYSPWQFCIKGDVKEWGTDAEVAALQLDFGRLKSTFVDRGIPVILGEYGAIRTTGAASRAFWMEWVAKASCDFGIAPYLWDNGTVDEFDRKTLTWRNPGLPEALIHACSGDVYVPSKVRPDAG
jgi:endoglucanase